MKGAEEVKEHSTVEQSGLQLSEVEGLGRQQRSHHHHLRPSPSVSSPCTQAGETHCSNVSAHVRCGCNDTSDEKGVRLLATLFWGEGSFLVERRNNKEAMGREFLPGGT